MAIRLPYNLLLQLSIQLPQPLPLHSEIRLLFLLLPQKTSLKVMGVEVVEDEADEDDEEVEEVVQ